MKTNTKGNAVRVIAAFLILSVPGRTLASSTLSQDNGKSDSTIVAHPLVAATRNQEALGPVVSPQTQKTGCAAPHPETPMASDADDPVLDDARKGVDNFSID